MTRTSGAGLPGWVQGRADSVYAIEFEAGPVRQLGPSLQVHFATSRHHREQGFRSYGSMNFSASWNYVAGLEVTFFHSNYLERTQEFTGSLQMTLGRDVRGGPYTSYHVVCDGRQADLDIDLVNSVP